MPKLVVLAAFVGLLAGACTTTEQRIGGAAVGAAVGGPVGAAAGVVAGPPVARQIERSTR